jgi:hypothetical protein
MKKIVVLLALVLFFGKTYAQKDSLKTSKTVFQSKWLHRAYVGYNFITSFSPNPERSWVNFQLGYDLSPRFSVQMRFWHTRDGDLQKWDQSSVFSSFSRNDTVFSSFSSREYNSAAFVPVMMRFMLNKPEKRFRGYVLGGITTGIFYKTILKSSNYATPPSPAPAIVLASSVKNTSERFWLVTPSVGLGSMYRVCNKLSLYGEIIYTHPFQSRGFDNIFISDVHFGLQYHF